MYWIAGICLFSFLIALSLVRGNRLTFNRTRRVEFPGALLGMAILAAGCEGVRIGERTVVDAMREEGYELGEATYNGRTGTVVVGYKGTRYASAADRNIKEGAKIILIRVNGVVVKEQFLDDIYADSDTVVDPLIVRYQSALAKAG